MKKYFLATLFIFHFCSYIYSQDDFETSTLLKVGDVVPEFIVNSIDGDPLSSNDFKGKVVLINFWATWCPPCRAEFPVLQKEIYDKIKNENFVVAAISRKEKKDTVEQFLNKTKYTFPIYLDSDAAVYKLFANKYIPRNFVVGKDGKIKWATMGFIKEEIFKMIDLINEELKN